MGVFPWSSRDSVFFLVSLASTPLLRKSSISSSGVRGHRLLFFPAPCCLHAESSPCVLFFLSLSLHHNTSPPLERRVSSARRLAFSSPCFSTMGRFLPPLPSTSPLPATAGRLCSLSVAVHHHLKTFHCLVLLSLIKEHWISGSSYLGPN